MRQPCAATTGRDLGTRTSAAKSAQHVILTDTPHHKPPHTTQQSQATGSQGGTWDTLCTIMTPQRPASGSDTPTAGSDTPAAGSDTPTAADRALLAALLGL